MEGETALSDGGRIPLFLSDGRRSAAEKFGKRNELPDLLNRRESVRTKGFLPALIFRARIKDAFVFGAEGFESELPGVRRDRLERAELRNFLILRYPRGPIPPAIRRDYRKKFLRVSLS